MYGTTAYIISYGLRNPKHYERIILYFFEWDDGNIYKIFINLYL